MPFLNEEGALELPYIEQAELRNVTGSGLPNLSRRESNTHQKAQSSNPWRCYSSGRKMVPQYDTANQPKRTVSATNAHMLGGDLPVDTSLGGNDVMVNFNSPFLP